MNRAATQIVTVVLLIGPFGFVGSVGLAFMGSTPVRARAEWMVVGPLSQIPEDGAPVRFRLVAVQRDAWMRLPDQAAGHVYVRRDSATHEIKVLAAAHGRLSAAVEYDPQTRCFRSQCYEGARFDLEGMPIRARDGSEPSREDGMAVLPAMVRDGAVFVRVESR